MPRSFFVLVDIVSGSVLKDDHSPLTPDSLDPTRFQSHFRSSLRYLLSLTSLLRAIVCVDSKSSQDDSTYQCRAQCLHPQGGYRDFVPCRCLQGEYEDRQDCHLFFHGWRSSVFRWCLLRYRSDISLVPDKRPWSYQALGRSHLPLWSRGYRNDWS